MIKRIHKGLRDRFVPSEENNDQPHFLRTGSVQLVMFALFGVQALFLVYTYVILPSSTHLAAIFAGELVAQTNEERVKYDVPTLKKNDLLEKSAQAKASDMAKRGYFSHYTPEGDAPWKFIRESGYGYRTAGENLAVNFIDSRDVTNAWMNSPTHRANLLAGKYTEVGIATAHGTYKGREAIFVVQHFGTPSGSGISLAKPSIPLKAAVGGVVAAAPTATSVVSLDPKPVMKVLGATTESKSSFWAMFLVEPHRMTGLVQLAIAALALTALLLAFFIRIRIQHPIIIANGIMLISITGTLLLINVLLSRGVI
jgi:uncharacterized protein YkwD